MGGKDFCCWVAGTPHVWDAEELVQQMLEHIHGGASRKRVQSFKYGGEIFTHGGHEIPPSVLEGLRFPMEEQEASTDCVLIAGYEPAKDSNSEDSIGELYCQMDDEPDIEVFTHATAVFDVFPDDEGIYVERKDVNAWYNIWWENSAFCMTLSSYCILRTVAPELDPSTIYRTFTHPLTRQNPESDWQEMPSAVDYGGVEKIFGQYMSRPKVCASDDADGFWTYLLCYSSLTDEEILDVAWNGEGNLWVYKRPDRFPIQEALELPPFSRISKRKPRLARPEDGALPPRFDRLPTEILFLICEEMALKSFLHVLSLSTHLRSALLPHADELAYKAMKNTDPCYFPCLPIKTPSGTREREELDWWEREWLRAGEIGPLDIRRQAPWLSYWVACTKSASMRNRKRVWKSAQSIKALALTYGFIDDN